MVLLLWRLELRPLLLATAAGGYVSDVTDAIAGMGDAAAYQPH